MQFSPITIGSAAKRFGELSLPLRLISGTIISLLAGTGLGFFAEYAGYRWALYHGIRPPLEGIPFLRVTVAALTASLLIGGALLFMLVQAICTWMLSTLEHYISQAKLIERVFKRLMPDLGDRNLVSAAVEGFRSIQFLTAFMSALGLGLAAAIFSFSNIHDGVSSGFVLASSLLAGVFTTMLFLLAWNPDSRVWISLGAVAIFLIIGPLLLFDIEVYGRLLRTIGYGGGLDVSIAISDEKANTEQMAIIQGSLLLRTSGALLLYQPEERRIREIPLEHVTYIDHTAEGINGRQRPVPPGP